MLAVLAIAGAVLYLINSDNSVETENLVIKDSNTGKIIGKWPLAESGEFAIEFIHSVNQSPVRENFVIENGNLRLHSVRFYSYGAGIQTSLDEGQILGRDGDAMIITGYTNSFKELYYIIGTVSDHILYINNEIINLRELAERPGGNVHISILYR